MNDARNEHVLQHDKKCRVSPSKSKETRASLERKHTSRDAVLPQIATMASAPIASDGAIFRRQQI
jgi:hypothetical protein